MSGFRISASISADVARGVIADAQLVALAHESRADALEQMYSAYKVRIYTFLLRLLADPEAADDLTQDVFTKAYQALGTLTKEHRVLPWLYRIDPAVLSWSLLALTLGVMAWAGRHFYVRAWSDFRHHSAAYAILPILRAHNRARVTVVCYSNVTAPDRVTEQLRALADLWHDVALLPDDELDGDEDGQSADKGGCGCDAAPSGTVALWSLAGMLALIRRRGISRA